MGQPAARLTDMHVCPACNGPVPHVGGPIIGPCSPNVFTGKLPQARITDQCLCVGPPDPIVFGAFTVLVNGLPAARMGDSTAHGGAIVMGLPTVLIGGAAPAGTGGGPGSPAPPGAAAPEGENPWKVEATDSVSQKPTDLEPEASRKIGVEYSLFDKAEAERQVWRFGDKENYARFLASDSEAKATASWDVDKKELEVGAEFQKSYAVAKGEVGGKAMDGLVSGKASGEALSASANAKAGITAGREGAKAGAEAGAEAVLVKGKAEGELRITPKTMYDNSVGRLTGSKLPASWDKGLVVGGSAEAGIGAAVKAKAEVAATAKEISLTLEGKAGAGPMAGLAGKLGVVW